MERKQTFSDKFFWMGRFGILIISLLLVGGVAITPAIINIWLDGLTSPFYVLSIPTSFIVWFLLVYFWWVPRNLCFTFIDEGFCKIVKKGGEFKKVIFQWKGHRFANEEEIASGKQDPWDIVEDKDYKEKWSLWGIFGFQWIGCYPVYDVLVYDFTWLSVEGDGSVEKHDPQELDHILLTNHMYGVPLDDAEDLNKLNLKVLFGVLLHIVNPYKAFFKIHDWLGSFVKVVQGMALPVIASNPYEQLTGGLHEGVLAGEKLADLLVRELNELNPTLFREWGIQFSGKVAVVSIDPPPKYREATLQKYLATQKGEGIIALAQAEAVAVKVRAEAEAAAIGMKARAKADAVKIISESGVDPNNVWMSEIMGAIPGQSVVAINSGSGGSLPPFIINPSGGLEKPEKKGDSEA